MQELVTLLSIAIGVVVTYDRVRTRGWSDAWQGPLLILALMIPPWLELMVRSVLINVRMAVSLVVLALFLFQPMLWGRRIHVYPSDYAMLLFLMMIAISDIVAGTITPLGYANVVLNWLLPYLMGRLFLRSSSDLHSILYLLVPVIVFMGLLTFAEGLFRVNFYNTLLGKSFGDPEIRWGLKRASGPQSHPIYWGVTLAIMIPFLLEAGRQANQGNGPVWWRYSTLLILPGIFASGSRSAQIAAMLILGFNAFYQYPRFRGTMAFLGIVGAVSFALYRDDVLNLMGQSINEADPTTNMVRIRGELHEYSGTLHRDLLFLAYQDAIEQVKPLGYGSLMKDLPRDLDADERFESVDNQYLRCYLQYGPIGLALFALLAICALGNFVPLLSQGMTPIGGFSAGILGSILAMLIALRGVWLSMDFGWFFLLYLGMSASLESVRRVESITPADGNYD